MGRRLSPDAELAMQRGLIAQPLVAAAAGFALFSWSIPMGLLMAVLFALAATVITVCLAYPLVLLLVRLGRVNPMTTLVSGVVLGNVPTAIAAIGTVARSAAGSLDPSGLLRPLGVGTLVGLAGAAVFWVVASPALHAD